jgi:pimeloyl-ACP methyl ester carboxylesterase
MMRLAICVLLVFASHAFAGMGCEFDLRSRRPAQRSFFSPTGLTTFESPATGRELAYDFATGHMDTQPVVFLHGLGEDMEGLREVQNEADADGFGIARPDLPFHGASLDIYMRKHATLPAELNYQDDVDDVVALIEHLNLKDVIIFGHSRGAAIGFKVASALRSHGARCSLLVMAAAYTSSIDSFLADYYNSPLPLSDASNDIAKRTVEMVKRTSFYGGVVSNIMQPLFLMSNYMVISARGINDSLKDLNAKIAQMFSLDKASQSVVDFVFQPFLRVEFRRYFTLMLAADPDRPSLSEQIDINVRVDAAVKVTRSMKELNLLSRSTKLLSDMPPILILGGERDSLVLPAQLKELADRFDASGLKYKLIFLKGDKAHHNFVKSMARETWQAVRAYQEELAGKVSALNAKSRSAGR